MAEILYSAGSDGVIANRSHPTAKVAASPEIGVLGSIVKLDGRPSLSDGGVDLTYTWSFDVSPIGSVVSREGFRLLEEDGSLVSFSPDKVGEYIVRLVVSNGMFEDSTTRRISIRAILVPDGRGIVPDGKFIWSYLRDVWQQVDNKEMFETLWSVLIQVTGAELVKAYQIDFNKSIRDIQDQMQRRWLCYEPRLVLDDDSMTAFVGTECAGLDGSTAVLGQTGKAIILSSGELVVIEGSVVSNPLSSAVSITYSTDPSNVGEYPLLGVNAAQSGYRLASPLPSPLADRILETASPTFTFQSQNWTFLSTSAMLAGDVLYIPSGVNQGFYRIKAVIPGSVTVDRAPPSFSSGTEVCTVYRPVGFELPQLPVQLTNKFAIPVNAGSSNIDGIAAGRIINIGSRSYSVFKEFVDDRQLVPIYTIFTDKKDVVSGLRSQAWRVPHTLKSSTIDFEALGVTTGDLLIFDVTYENSNSLTEVAVQVLGVVGNRLGFVLTKEPLSPGEPYVIPDELFDSAALDLNIGAFQTLADGSTLRSGQAKQLFDFLSSLEFQTKFWNKELTLSDGIRTPIGTFYVRPKAIVRNTTVPVDGTLRSVPTLQEWIVQPNTTTHDGKLFQVRNGQEFEIDRPPSVIIEGNDYLVDDEMVFDETATFTTGTSILEIDGSGLRDRGVAPGDVLTLTSPVPVAGDYPIVEILGLDRVLLAKPIPAALGGVITTRTTITRRRGGSFLRFVPGMFTPKSPAPNRYWAEVSYFDNGEVIENNFGILVGLTRADLEAASSNIPYRQAVAGLMFAYSRGAALEKVRLGAQILLGLPFAEYRGIIRSIDEDYRLDTKGVPVQGRILIEDVDQAGNPLGIQRIYLYPIDTQSFDLSGVETNPATGRTYEVGDIVDLFAPLAKGVKVSDYVSDPTYSWSSARGALQQFHSFRLVVNDNIFDLKEIELVSDFLRRITPSYVTFLLTNSSEFVDLVSISDQLIFKHRLGTLIDNTGLGLNVPVMFDQTTLAGWPSIFWGDGIRTMRASGKAAGTDGTPSSVDVGASVASPIARAGDVLYILAGSNSGSYLIDSIAGSVVTVDGTVPFVSASDQEWMIVRPVEAELRNGTATDFSPVTGPPATTWLTVEAGVIADGVMFGDWLLFDHGTSFSRHYVVGVEDTRIEVLPALSSPSLPAAYHVFRQAFIEGPTKATYTLVSNGTSYTSLDAIAMALLDPKDELLVRTGTEMSLFVRDPLTRSISPVLPNGSYTVSIVKKKSLPAPEGFGLVELWNVHDQADVKLTPAATVTTTAGNRTVDVGSAAADIGIVPGDMVHFVDNNQTDHGYGVGAYVVVSLAGSVLTLDVAPEQSGATHWEFLRPNVDRTPQKKRILSGVELLEEAFAVDTVGTDALPTPLLFFGGYSLMEFHGSLDPTVQSHLQVELQTTPDLYTLYDLTNLGTLGETVQLGGATISYDGDDTNYGIKTAKNATQLAGGWELSQTPYNWIGEYDISIPEVVDVHPAVDLVTDSYLPVILTVNTSTGGHSTSIPGFQGALYRGAAGMYTRIEVYNASNALVATLLPGDPRISHANSEAAYLDVVTIDGSSSGLFGSGANWSATFFYEDPPFSNSWYSNFGDPANGLWTATFKVYFL